MDLDHAIKKHGEWQLAFRDAIERQECVDAQSVARDDACELGKWLRGEARKEYGRLRSYPLCLARHALFHAEAAKVANVINARQFEQAAAMLAVGSAYARAASEVCNSILSLKREAGL